MADASRNTPGRTAGWALDASVRNRLLALLREELARAGDEALARGMSPQELSAQLDDRVARIRAQIEELPAGEQAA
jgi:hypothetical protein